MRVFKYRISLIRTTGVRHLTIGRGTKEAILEKILHEHFKSVLGRSYEQPVGTVVRSGLVKSKILTEEGSRSLFSSQLIACKKLFFLIFWWIFGI